MKNHNNQIDLTLLQTLDFSLVLLMKIPMYIILFYSRWRTKQKGHQGLVGPTRQNPIGCRSPKMWVQEIRWSRCQGKIPKVLPLMRFVFLSRRKIKLKKILIILILWILFLSSAQHAEHDLNERSKPIDGTLAEWRSIVWRFRKWI